MPERNRIGDAMNHWSYFIRFGRPRISMGTEHACPIYAIRRAVPASGRDRSKLEKRALMAEYLRPLPVPEAGLAALYLAGAPFPETDGRELKVGGAALSRVLASSPGPASPLCMPPTCAMATWAAPHKTFCRDEEPRRRPFRCPKWLRLCRHRRCRQASQEAANHPGPAQKGHAARGQVPDQDHPGRYAHRHPGQPGGGGDRRRLQCLHRRSTTSQDAERQSPRGAGAGGHHGRLAEARMKLFHPLGLHAGQPGRDGRGGPATLQH